MRKILTLLMLLVSTHAIAGKLAISTSIVDLTQNPERYNGKLVLIKGYIGSGLVQHRIYLDKTQLDIHNTELSIHIKDQNRESIFSNCAPAYVSLVGRFIAEPVGNKYLAPNRTHVVHIDQVRSVGKIIMAFENKPLPGYCYYNG